MTRAIWRPDNATIVVSALLQSCESRNRWVRLWTANPLWVLTAGSQAKTRVNGGALLDRFRLLQDRDEIRIRTKRFYFAAKSPPMVIKYTGLTRERTKTGRSYARNVSGVSNRSPRPCVAQSVRAGIISQKMNRAGRRVSRARCVRKPQTCTHSLSGALKTERLSALRLFGGELTLWL